MNTALKHEQTGAGNDPRARLMQALQEDRFVLYAQSIRPLSGSAPYARCFEVLLRLQDENRRMLPPDVFFPMADRYLMQEIDRWVVRNVIQWCLKMQRGDPAWRMPLCCVNLTAASLCEPGFAIFVQDELRHSAFPAGKLCFEIAEPDVNDHHAAVQALMGMLRPPGCSFTLEAFGRTKVSFVPLRDLPFDFLKIDGVIIHNILTHPADLSKIRAIAMAAQRFGLRTIAEFVESDDTLEKLRGIGIDYAQGFGIGRPAPIAQMS